MSKPICVVQAPFFIRAGYGGLADAVGKSLLRYNKFDLYLAPTKWGACSKKNLESDFNDPENKELLSKVLRGPLPRQPEVFIQITIPNEFHTPGKFNIGYTAGIETTAARGEWIEGLNRMDLNLVTSVHARDIFAYANYTKTYQDGRKEQLVVNKPMEILFWGADTKIYKKTSEPIESVNKILSTIPEDFAFLFVGQWTSGNINGDRKDIGYLIKTFLETFKDVKGKKPCLLLKTSGAAICVVDRYECINKINEVTRIVQTQFPNDTLPNVYLIHGELNDVEMNALFNHDKVKAHLSFTHGEGFGHPLLLATLSGKPVIASRWSGHLDFLNPKYAKFFDGELKPLPPEAVNEWLIKESMWFNVNYSKAGERMKSLFHNYGGFLDDYEKLRIENEQKFSLEAMDRDFHAILDKYIPKFALEQKIVLPKLKKIELPKNNLPDINSPPIINLPKLKRVELPQLINK